jgi:hypothetical protein
MSHLLVAITAHGFGHVAQTAPVVNALRRRLPKLRLTLYTSLPRSFLASRFAGDFTHIARCPDVGMCMKDALQVDAAASARAYRHFHRDWEMAVAREARLLKDCAPDAILANWMDLYRHCCAAQPEAATILEQMLGAYHSVHAFLQPVPHMPMPDLEKCRAIGPIARLGTDRRSHIRQRCRLPADGKLVLVSLGGVPTQLNLAAWPPLSEVHWIVPASLNPQRRDMVALESLDMDFVDVLRSVDALITKPGYGSFVEAACNGVPVLYAPRLDWPEERFLLDWLRAHGRCLPVQRQQLLRGDFADALQQLFSQPAPEAVAPSGVAEAVGRLSALLQDAQPH